MDVLICRLQPWQAIFYAVSMDSPHLEERLLCRGPFYEKMMAAHAAGAGCACERSS